MMDTLETMPFSNAPESIERNDNHFMRVDGWDVRESVIFPGFWEIVKSRKHEDPLTIHINPVTGRVRKYAGEPLYNPRIDKEVKLWGVAMELFEVDAEVVVGSVRRLKDNPSKGYEEVKFIDMPYMGIPFRHYQRLNRDIPHDAIEKFRNRMVTLVEKNGVFFPDMNEGNVLIRVVDGQEILFPIDWESAQTNRVSSNIEYYVNETIKRCSKLFGE